MRTALGFRPHTGWTIVVAVGEGPVVLDRRRLDLSDPAVPVQVFHAVAELSLDSARELVSHADEVAGDAAARAVRGLVADLRAAGHDVVAAGVPADAGRLPETLQAILASHPYLHTAEGRLYREALAGAAADCGLQVLRLPAKELAIEAEALLGLDAEALRTALTDLGRGLGPPWRQDHRDAALAAWLALGAEPPGA